MTSELEHDSITDNPRDNIEDLLTPGEVVTAHSASILDAPTPEVTLRLDIVDDDPAPAPTLLDGGPPWLMLAAPEAFAATSVQEPPEADGEPGLAVEVDDHAVPSASPVPPRPTPPAAGASRATVGASSASLSPTPWCVRGPATCSPP